LSSEILINVTPSETRVAVVENGVVQELIIERTAKRGLVGNIYKGKVCRVLPGMQAAFVDAGLERAAFLHASDIQAGEAERSGQITDLVREGGEVIVQVVKDPLGTKGARLTTNISIPSRFMVFMPNVSNVGVSQKIEDESERARLREILTQFAESNSVPVGFIARTAADGVSEEALCNDMRFLVRLWNSIRERAASAPGRQLIHEDLPLPLRALRDLINPEVEKVRIDSRSTWEKAQQFAFKYFPDQRSSIEYYPGERPIFDLYGVEDEIQKALERKVDLKSGGHLVIDQTEAMTTIDVNTGGFVGLRNFDDTIFKTNLEAAQTIARQLRLRNLGGIIIVDFIDMDSPEHREAVIDELNKALARDHTRVTVNGFTALGLVEMTRKRTRESLAHVLCEMCPTCGGRGEVKTARTVAYEILRELLREARQFNAREFRILASPSVVDLFLDEESQSVAMLSDFIGKPVSLHAEPGYTQEQYDIVLL
jgi:ribonuclease G